MKNQLLLVLSSFLVLHAACSKEQKNEFSVLNGIETYQAPPRTIDDYPLPKEAFSNEIMLKVWYDIQQDFLRGGSAYKSRKERCGEDSVPPTYVDTFISDLVGVLDTKFSIKLTKESTVEGNIKKAIAFMKDTEPSNLFGLRSWDNKKFLQSLTDSEINQLVGEIVKYCKEIGVKKGTFDSIQAENEKTKLATIDTYFQEQKRGKSGVELFCRDQFTNPVSFFAVTAWDIVDSGSSNSYTMRINSSNRGGIPIIGLYKIELSTKENNRCSYTDVCIREISKVE